MFKTKDDIIRELGPVSDQGAIVRKLTQKSTKPIKFVIPGGKHLTEQLDKNTIKKACYNWLRRCKEFNGVTIWLCKDAGKYHPTFTKLEDFQVSEKGPAWQTMSTTTVSGKMWLAEKMGAALFEYMPLGIQAKPDGLYLINKAKESISFNTSSPDWEPWVEISPKRRNEWATT